MNWGRIKEHSEDFCEELDNVGKVLTALRNTVTEMKNTPQDVNKRWGDKECISDLEARVMQTAQ